MIVCRDILKQYGRQVVLADFSCEFADTGFYLLYGESGSGKTTFLNILSGMLPFDGGTVTVNGTAFHTLVEPGRGGIDFDYITQDTFFADFLTVFDNLRLISQDDTRIAEVLKRFGLAEAGNQYPATLSGGERQRLAFARACLSGKKVLFLDEPTASLDEENKKAVFELLHRMKQDTLIICSSHDAVAKDYADETIAFEKCPQTRDVQPAPPLPQRRCKAPGKPKSAHCMRYLSKWFTSSKRTQRSDWKFCFFLVLAFLLLMLGDLPAHKQEMNLAHSYRVNALVLTTCSKEGSDYATLEKMPGVKKVVLSYGGSTPMGVDSPVADGSGMLLLPDYEISLYTLPFEREFFPLAGKIAYGSYFTADNQVLLSNAEAEKLSPGNHEALIGSTITKNIYSLGDTRFEIVGVLGKLNEFEKNYLLSLEMEDGGIYFNSRLTQRFVDDNSYYRSGQRTYHLYFDSYGELSSFYSRYHDTFESKGEHLSLATRLNVGKQMDMLQMMAIVLLPLSAFITLFTILFYSSLLKTEIAYNNRFIAVFEYAGYGINGVISRLALLYVVKLLILSAISFLAAFATAQMVNGLNRSVVFIGFQPFTVNLPILAAFVLLVAVCALAGAFVSLRRLRIGSWYDNLIHQRDLL